MIRATVVKAARIFIAGQYGCPLILGHHNYLFLYDHACQIARLRRALRKRVWKQEAMVCSEGCNDEQFSYKTKYQCNERTVLINL